MNKWSYSGRVILGALLIVAAQATATAQSADRTVLPLPPAPYTNQIGVSYQDSVPQIHPPLAAPPGAPNVLLVLIDDAGYAENSTFGGTITTPTLDRLAAGGLRYTRFHVAALCSPSRAALLTGRNHHAVHMGVVAGDATSYPGYDGDIPKSAAFISEILRENGYSTAAFGKWHLVPEWEMSSSGPFDHWPTGQGFEYFYGFLGGNADQWSPELYEDTSPTALKVPPGQQDEYTLNVALADKAISWIQRQKSVTPGRPFFVYYAPGATHAPIQAPKSWREKFKGKFDMGWDRYREMVFARQKQLGVVPSDAELTPRPAELPAWDSLSPVQQQVAARLMEVYAGFMAQTDHEIGRVVDAIAATGQLDNTLILYIAGDNGASLEGGLTGNYNLMANANGVHETAEQMMTRLDQYGLANTSPHYPAAWGWAGNTPFQWGKSIASHLGGTRDPLVVYWPDRIKDAGGVRGQFHHLIDVVPTLLEAAHLPEPTSVDGVRQMPFAGVSMVYTFDNPAAPERHLTQYFEIMANRSIYHDGWIAGARSGHVFGKRTGTSNFETQPWELYQLEKDYTERTNVASLFPDKLKSLQDLFMDEARKNNVLPIDPRFMERRMNVMLPSLNPGRTLFTYYSAPQQVPDSEAPRVFNRSFTVSAELVMPPQGGDGVIVCDGGRFGGYSFFVKNRSLQYAYNFVGLEHTVLATSEKLPIGPVKVGLRFDYDGGGLGKGGSATLFVNGKSVGAIHVPRTAPVAFTWYESFDVGLDAGTAVGDYASPFPFQGEIRTVVFNISPPKLTMAEQAQVREGERLAEAATQ